MAGNLAPKEKYLLYLEALRHPFQKLCRLRFLQPDGSTAFALDNNEQTGKGKAFISEGSLSVQLQNGRRRTADITLSNVDGEYDYSVNKLWFGTEVALDEGLILPNGEEYYIQQGVFLIDTPDESITPTGHTISYNLVDKWSNLDGSLFGNLEGTYEVARGTNIFSPMQAILNLDKGNGIAVDRTKPIFTEYYNGKTQTLSDGTTAALTNSPYTLTVDGDGGTYAEVILGLAEMVNAWVGYDPTGALRIDPSQDDILDSTKPIIWDFSNTQNQLLGLTYTTKNTEVYNDYIVVGEQLDDYTQPAGRAQNLDPSSDTNIGLIGRKTVRESAAGYATSKQCEDLAAWKLKRSTILQKTVSISCSQILHIQENQLVLVERPDKQGSPKEKHLIQGFSRPLAGNGAMTIDAVSTVDFPITTISGWPD